MTTWTRFAQWKPARLVAILVVALVVLLFPWPAAGTQTYSACEPSLATINPPNATSVWCSSTPNVIHATAPPAASGSVRLDLIRTYVSFEFATTAMVGSQSGFVDGDWMQVSAAAGLPHGATAFSILFQGANATTQLAAVDVFSGGPGNLTLFAQNFTASTTGWQLYGSSSFGEFGTPARAALQINNSGTNSGKAITSTTPPIPSSVDNVVVRALVRFQGLPGPFAISLDILSSTGRHLAYVTDWAEWANYSIPAVPLSLVLWNVQFPVAAEVVFLANGSDEGDLGIAITNGSSVVSLVSLVPYHTGEPVSLSVTRTAGESFSVAVETTTGDTAEWSSVSNSAVTELARGDYFTLSVVTNTPLGVGASASLQNATYTFAGSPAFRPLASSVASGIVALVALVAVVALLSPELTPRLRASLQWIRRVRRSTAARVLQTWATRNAVTLGLVGGTLATYFVVALLFGGQPYDTWSYTVWNYSGQLGSTRAIYIQTHFIGDAVVRGDNNPWGTVGFAYGPLAAYLFAGMSAILPSLDNYPTAYALYAALGVQTEIKWILGLFSVAAGVAAFLGVRKYTGRTNLALIALVLIVFNPAVGFDSVVWGETDSVMYLLFVLFALAAYYRPTWAVVVAALAVAFKETGLILLFPTALLILGPGIPGLERLKRLTAGIATLLLVTAPLLLWGIVPSVLFSPFTLIFGVFISGSGLSIPWVSPETYTVWTLFTGLTGGSGITRLLTASSTLLVGGASYALLGLAAFAGSWVGLFLLTRQGSRKPSLEFWFASTAFAAISFTALLTGTGSRYYTLAIPGLAAVVVLVWERGRARQRWLAASAYILVTALGLWTMYGVLAQTMLTDVPEIRGLAFATNPMSRFVAEWYLSNGVITAGSVGAAILVILAAWLLIELAGGLRMPKGLRLPRSIGYRSAEPSAEPRASPMRQMPPPAPRLR